MARPQKPRTIESDLPAAVFKPQGIPLAHLQEVVLSLDGFEVLRRVDVEELDQLEAARRMGISRSTLSRVLAEARRVVATALAKGHAIRIEGGTVVRASCRANRSSDGQTTESE